MLLDFTLLCRCKVLYTAKINFKYTPSSIREVHRNPKVCISLLEWYWKHCYSLCWGNSRISTVTQVRCATRSLDGSDPHFLYTLKDVWPQLSQAPKEEPMTPPLDRCPKPQQQTTCSFPKLHFYVTYDIRDEHRLQQVCKPEAEVIFWARCKLHPTQSVKIFLRQW